MSMSDMADFTGYGKRTKGILAQLIERRWVLYDERTRVLWLRNTLRFDPMKPLRDDRKRKSIIYHLAGLPRSPIIKLFLETYELTDQDGATQLIESINKLEGASGGAPEGAKGGANVALSPYPLIPLSPKRGSAEGEIRNGAIPVRGPWPSVEALATLWNERAPDEVMAVEKFETADRIKAARRVLRANPDIEFWDRVMAQIRASPFLKGSKPTKGHPNWKASFDWLLNENTAVRVYEGVYKD